MSATQPITKLIGTAERTLQALLKSQLDRDGLSFEEWVVFNFVDGGKLVDSQQLLAALADGKVAEAADAQDLLDSMVEKGLLDASVGNVSLTARARQVFEPVQIKVRGLVSSITQDIPEEDMAATHRTLSVLTERAAAIYLADTPTH